jgi:hypothetical protein
MVETELALITEIDHFLHIRLRQLLHIPIDRIHIQSIKQHPERRTQRQTPPTPTTDVIDPSELGIDLSKVPELRLCKIKRRASHGLYPKRARRGRPTGHANGQAKGRLHMNRIDLGMVETAIYSH